MLDNRLCGEKQNMAPLNQQEIVRMCQSLLNTTIIISSPVERELDVSSLDDLFGNSTDVIPSTDQSSLNDEDIQKLNEFHIIKVVVLSVVTLLVLLSLCKVMFGMFLKQPRKPDK